MELTLQRNDHSAISTIGDLFLDGKFECHILEDVDRGLHQDMLLDEIIHKKIPKRTAIPSGRYEIKLTWSKRFQKVLPQIMNVPGYDGVRIHSGNTAVDTEGCLMPGTTKGVDAVYNSKVAFNSLYQKLLHCKQEMFITIK
jgi:hypothetical protein